MEDNVDYLQKTISNANRLLADSKILRDHGRWISSAMLRIFAIEELGKALVERWGVKNEASNREYPTHIEKQAAVFSLLLSEEFFQSSPEDMRAILDRSNYKLSEFGPYHAQFVWARAGFYDDLRMVATYADKEPKWPNEATSKAFDRELIDELHTFFRQTLIASQQDNVMNLAAIVYRNDLVRL